MNTMHGVFKKIVDELLALLHKHFLLEDNCLLSNMYSDKTLTSKVGLDYTNIHACVHVFFYSKKKCITGVLSKMWLC
jgi:hypothetical protein